MKKFISVALAVLMILSVVPMTLFTVSAAGTASVTIKDAQGNTPEAAKDKTTINAAFDWVYAQTNSEDYTIYLNGDVTTGDYLNPESYDSKNVKTVRIDGQGYTLTSTSGTAVFYGIGLYNLKLTDLNIVASSANSMDWSPRKNTSDNYANYISTGTNPVMDTFAEFTRVTLVPAAGAKAGVFKLKGGNSGAKNTGTYNITLTDCEFTSNVADTMFMMNDKGCLNLKVVGTTLNYKGGANTHIGNSHMFALNGSDFAIEVVNSENNVSVLNVELPETCSSNAGVFYTGHKDKYNFKFGEGVVIALNSPYVVSSYFIYNNNGTQTFVDEGAIFKACVESANKNVILPTLNGEYWYVDGELVNNVYSDPTATDDVVFTHGALADGATAPSAYPVYIGSTGYADLASAVAAATSGATIKLVRDIKVGGAVKIASKNLTIDGQGYTIFGDYGVGANYLFDMSGGQNYSFTIKNATVYSTQGFWFKYGTMNFENCDIYTAYGLALRNAPDANMNVVINLTDTDWVYSNARLRKNEPFALLGNGADSDLTINLVNSSISANTGTSVALSTPNTGMFNHNTKGDVVYNIDATSTLAIDGPHTGSIWNNAASASSLTINLAKGATIKSSGTAAGYVVHPSQLPKTYTYNDKGADYVIEAFSSLRLPATVNGTAVSWYKDGEAVALAGDAYVTADEAVTLNFGAKATVNPVYVLVNGQKTYYATLQAAVDALGAIYAAVTEENLTDDALWKAAGSPVIYLEDDVMLVSTVAPSWWNTNYNANRVRTVVIKSAKADGENAKIIGNTMGGMIRYNSYYNLTLENVDMIGTMSFALFWSGYNGGQNSGKSTTNIINCNIEATGTAGEGLVFKVTGNQNQSLTENYIINIEGSNIVAKKGVNAVFLFHHGCAGELNIDGESTITHTNDRLSAGGDTLFMMGTNRYFDINVASGAELTSNVELTQWGSYAMFRTENSNTYPAANGKAKNTINIEAGAKLTVNATDKWNYPVYFIDQLTTASKAPTVINIENGAEFALNEAAAGNGFAVINGTFSNSSVIGCNVNEDGKLYKSFVPAGTFDEAVTSIVPVFYNGSEDFYMVDGASLRTVYLENGIRFSSNVSLDLCDALGDNAVYGTIIAPGTADPTAFEGEKLDIVHKNSYFDEDNGVITNYAAVIMPLDVDAKTAYELELAAVAYFTVTYADGTTETFYADFNAEDNVRSMLEVAQNLKDAGITNRVIDRILEVCA